MILQRHIHKIDRLHRKTHTHHNYSNYIITCNSYRHNMFRTKSEFYQSKITDDGTNFKTHFKITDSLLDNLNKSNSLTCLMNYTAIILRTYLLSTSKSFTTTITTLHQLPTITGYLTTHQRICKTTF